MNNNGEKKSNFKVALHEIMKGKLTNNSPEEKIPTAEKTHTVEAKEYNQEPSHKVEIKTNKNEATNVSEDTIIEGSIKSQSDLIIKGKINGDVESNKSINISGLVVGNVKGDSSISLEGSINGNITSVSIVNTSKESKITGDVDCGSLDVEGTIIGNINSANSVIMGANSFITGDIVAKTISIKEGAKIKGSLNINEVENIKK